MGEMRLLKMSYKVKISSFEGPFDLLVYLIENAQMSVYDIQISQITAQYMEYMEDINTIDVERATEFMVLAASLLEIKSKMILPTDEGEVVGIVEEDPRSQLVDRLLEYKAFKQRADSLKSRWEFAQDIFEKPKEDISEFTDNPDEYLSLSIDEFAKAFNDFLDKKQRIDQVRRHYTRIERDRVSMESRMVYIYERLKGESFSKEGKRRLLLTELVPGSMDKYNLVVTFAAALQMINRKTLKAEQKSLYGDIILELIPEAEKQQTKDN